MAKQVVEWRTPHHFAAHLTAEVENVPTGF